MTQKLKRVDKPVLNGLFVMCHKGLCSRLIVMLIKKKKWRYEINFLITHVNANRSSDTHVINIMVKYHLCIIKQAFRKEVT